MKQIISSILLLVVLGFTNSRSNVNSNEPNSKSIDTTFVVNGSGIKIIVKKGKLILTEKEYFLDNEINLDTITLEKTKFTPEGPGALGGESISYYQNGQIKEKGQTKNEFGCWMDSGIFEYYSIRGNLIKTVHFDNWKNDEDGCHATVHDITQENFYPDGKIKAIKYFQSAYEEGELNPVGEWKFYNKNGKIIQIEKYKRVYLKNK